MAEQPGDEKSVTGNGEEQSAEASAAADEVAQASSTGGETESEAGPSPSVAEVVAEATPEVGPTGQQTPAGWFQDPNVPNQQRYWDGSTWTDQTKVTEAGISTVKRSGDERKALLAQQIQGAAARGLRVESQSEFQAVLVEGKPINHVLHAIITFFTCGLWGIVWIILAVTGGEKREMTVVDEFGNVQLQKLGKA